MGVGRVVLSVDLLRSRLSKKVGQTELRRALACLGLPYFTWMGERSELESSKGEGY